MAKDEGRGGRELRLILSGGKAENREGKRELNSSSKSQAWTCENSFPVISFSLSLSLSSLSVTLTLIHEPWRNVVPRRGGNTLKLRS